MFEIKNPFDDLFNSKTVSAYDVFAVLIVSILPLTLNPPLTIKSPVIVTLPLVSDKTTIPLESGNVIVRSVVGSFTVRVVS